MKYPIIHRGGIAALAGSLTLCMSAAMAHDDNAPGTPVCLEANYMMADAMNAPFAGPVTGPGRVVEMNIFTGERGITVANPFSAGNAGTPICNDDVSCPGPWKPTGVLSGGLNGHAFLTSAGQHAITEFHRDGTPVRSAAPLPTSPSPAGGNFGFVPRLLGSQIMPNGNLIQAVCDANFFNAANADPVGPGEDDPAGDGNSSNLYFPPVYSTAARASNSRLLVLDQETLEVIDEYSAPNDPRWSCPAGIAFSSEGMWVSGFHSAAVFLIDWKAGLSGTSTGVGSNDQGNFKLDRGSNRARVIRVVDLLGEGAAADDPARRDSLRAISLDESGNLYGTWRARSRDCVRGEYAGSPGGCNPSVFRQHVFIATTDPFEAADPLLGSVALDPGVNVIAGIRVNRMSGPGCEHVRDEVINAGGTLSGDECDVETVYVATSAGNAGCDKDNDGNPGPGHPANRCFVPGGTVYEYLIDTASLDGVGGPCTGDPNDAASNAGCAAPIAEFVLRDAGGNPDLVDPRMLMPIHEAFIQ